MRRSFFALSALIGLASGIGQVKALDTVTVDQSCRVEGLSRPLRQTIVVIDQEAIRSAKSVDVGDKNRRWINKVLAIAGVQEGQSALLSAPRERITVVVARQDGSDLIRVFSGCSPTYSQDEVNELKKPSSGFGGQLERFFGRDVNTRLENARKTFRSRLTASLAELIRSPIPNTAKDERARQSSFLDALPLLTRGIDLADGIPRIVVISPFQTQAIRALADQKSARSLGFDMASRLGADLQRAEVYLTGTENAGRLLNDFGSAFFLGIKGRLSGTSGETLPTMAAAPQQLQVFSGFIDYAGVMVPMQLRLAVDRAGSLVNSWVEVTVKRPVATPITGKAVCKGNNLDHCEVKGDGREFAQSWVVEVGQNPKFDESLPFSGVRYFEFTTTPSGLKGRVYDPIVVLNGRKDLPFELARTREVQF